MYIEFKGENICTNRSCVHRKTPVAGTTRKT